MTRFFMTIPESAGLVIEAATLANESGSTYILDMGRPIKIVDLVQRYVKFMEYDEPEIVFTGVRKGEKIDEELLDAYESYKTTIHPRIRSVDVSSLAPRDEVNLLYHNVLHDTSSEELQTALKRLVTVNQTVMMGDLTKLQETIRLI
jgi:FlaA1/EpsC-like NDP-sugar epimerase